MRLIVWNCQGGFKSKKKFTYLQNENPDIVIVPECLKRDALEMQAFGFEVQWVGDSGIKVLAVFAAMGWHLEPMAKSTAKWILPVKVTGPEDFTLLAVWSCPDQGSKISYVSMLHDELKLNEKWFAEKPVVVAGDFNSNPNLDRKGAVPSHNSMVCLLKSRGLVSAYHCCPGCEPGEETHKTFFAGRKSLSTHHIDYIFVPTEWTERIASVDVLPEKPWTDRSDHCPLVLQLNAA